MSDGPVECPNCPDSFIYNAALGIVYECPKCGFLWDGHFPIKDQREQSQEAAGG